MLDLIRKFRRRLVGRMLLFVVLPTTVIFASIVYMSSRASFENLRHSEEKYIQLQARLVATEIEDLTASAVITAQRMAEAQVAGMFGDREASIEYARLVLKNSEGINGAGFGYEPDADGKDSESLGKLPAEAMDPSGRFSPYWFVDSTKGRRITLEPLADMESTLCYSGAKQDFEKTGKPAPKVTEPYVYQGKLVTEQAYPIVINGEFKGVAAVDFSLDDVEAMLRRIAKTEDFDIYLISPSGNFIAATTDPLDGEIGAGNGMFKTRNVEDIEGAELFVRLNKNQSMSAPLLDVDPSDGETYYFAASRVPVGGWMVVVRKPESVVLAPIWAQLRTRLAFATGGIVLILTLLLTMVVRLARRVNIAVEAAKRVAAGDLTGEFHAEDGGDETGVLLCSIGNMTDNLNTLVGNVKQASIQLNSTATELSATSHQQKSTVSSFGSSANQIAAATKQISATNSELLDTMEGVNQVAVNTAALATAGRSSLQGMENSMRDLDNATSSIGEKLAVINEKASNITGVVTTITKVADQTNLLSVNAAIEAEKAGEYGVGFLVVAREIRRLADQTSAATLDIEQMVGQMQSAVTAGVMEMDRFTDHVRRNVKDVAKISQQMADIIEQVNSNTTQFESVNESMQSQAQGAEQISIAMGQLTTVAAQSSEAIHEYARASDDLHQAIDSLKSSVASFRLKS